MESIIYVGIDVHKDTYSLCSFDMQKDIFFSQHTVKASTVHTAFKKGHWSVEKGTIGAQKRTA